MATDAEFKKVYQNKINMIINKIKVAEEKAAKCKIFVPRIRLMDRLCNPELNIHEYEHYIGLRESYEYCIHCDFKKAQA